MASAQVAPNALRAGWQIRLVDGGMAHMTVEVAIRTFREAERSMDGNAEGRPSLRSACVKAGIRELEKGAGAMRQG
jgi:hypothetical protein